MEEDPLDLRHRRRRVKDRGQSVPDAILKTWTKAQRIEYQRAQALETPTAEMGMSVRVVNALESAGVFLAKDLLEESAGTLLAIKNFGESSLAEVSSAIKRLGLPLPRGWRRT